MTVGRGRGDWRYGDKQPPVGPFSTLGDPVRLLADSTLVILNSRGLVGLDPGAAWSSGTGGGVADPTIRQPLSMSVPDGWRSEASTPLAASSGSPFLRPRLSSADRTTEASFNDSSPQCVPTTMSAGSRGQATHFQRRSAHSSSSDSMLSRIQLSDRAVGISAVSKPGPPSMVPNSITSSAMLIVSSPPPAK